MSDVNPQVIDAITITNTQVVAHSPAMAMASLYQSISNSVAMASINSVYAQQQQNMAFQAATTLGITRMFAAI